MESGLLETKYEKIKFEELESNSLKLIMYELDFKSKSSDLFKYNFRFN